MADNIVAGLFGLTPQMYGEQQRVGALNEDLRTACLKALDCDRTACREHAEAWSWDACVAQFRAALVPIN